MNCFVLHDDLVSHSQVGVVSEILNTSVMVIVFQLKSHDKILPLRSRADTRHRLTAAPLSLCHGLPLFTSRGKSSWLKSWSYVL